VYKGNVELLDEIKAFVDFHRVPVAMLIKKGDKVLKLTEREREREREERESARKRERERPPCACARAREREREREFRV
jgi:hypothetical protein